MADQKNDDLPIAHVQPWYREAFEHGCYTEGQLTNFDTPWGLILGQLEQEGKDANEITVGQLQKELKATLRSHGNSSSASARTIKTYGQRVGRLLNDFIEHYGGDWMAWKEKIEASKSGPKTSGESSAKRKKSRAKKPRAKQTEPPQPPAPDGEVYEIFLPDGAKGELRLPRAPSSADLEAIWSQLELARTVIEAKNQLAARQSQVLAGKSGASSANDAAGPPVPDKEGGP